MPFTSLADPLPPGQVNVNKLSVLVLLCVVILMLTLLLLAMCVTLLWVMLCVRRWMSVECR